MKNAIKTITRKLEQKLKIKRCYGCGKMMWWDKRVLRYIEDPDDLGFVAPACPRCIREAEEHQYDI